MGKKSLLLICTLLVLSGCAPASTEEPVESATEAPGFVEGDSCEMPGEEVAGPRGPMLCTYRSGVWVYLSIEGNGKYPEAMPESPLPVEECKIKDQRPPEVRYFGATGFPAPKSRMPATGEIEIAIIPIDFPDALGTEDPLTLIQDDLDAIDAWTEFFTGGRIKYKWVTHDKWLTMPKESKYYVWDKTNIVNDQYVKQSDKQLQSNADQASQVFTEAEKVMDLTRVEYAWIFSNPEATLVDWGPGPTNSDAQTIKTPNNTYVLDYFPIGAYFYGSIPGYSHNRPIWTVLLHEMGHAHGLAGHAPGNEWTFDYMTAGGTLSAWNGWIMGWIPDDEIICIDGTKPGSFQMRMDSVDLNRGGPIAAVIKLSDHEVIVVESRRKGPFSIDFQTNWKAVMAYYVNTKREANRYDGNLLREFDYFSYFLRIENPTRPYDPNAYQLDPNILGQIGETLAYENIRIKYIDPTNFDTIKVEVLAN